MDDEFLQDQNAIASRISTHADSEDGQRIAQMAQHIVNHDWEKANALIVHWSVQDEPDWTDIPDPFDGGYSYVN
jgi:hypothetical protein